MSITTVSDALNGKGRLPDATRRHVREVADRLGYRPSAAARTLRTGKSGLIGLTVTTYGDEPFTFTEFAYFAEMARAATSAALARGYALVILPATSRHDVWSNVALDGTVVIDPSDQDPVVSELVRRGCLSSPTAARPARSRSPPGSTTTTRPPVLGILRPPGRRRRPPDRPADRDHHGHVHPSVDHRLPALVRACGPGSGV
ncbi:HTH-type transcriptional repressor PurR [Streptomyces alboniger]